MRASCRLLLLLLPFPLQSAEDRAEKQLIKSLEARYSRSMALRAVFEERYYENGRLLRTEGGKVRFRRPGKMRWDYESPESKLFVSDGHTLWLYIPAERMAQRSAVKESADWRTPFTLLTRSPRLARLCQKVRLGEANEALRVGDEVLHCKARNSGEVGERGDILIEASPKTGELHRVRMDSGGGVAIEFLFSQWADDANSAEREFQFVPPAGVAIVNAFAENPASEEESGKVPKDKTGLSGNVALGACDAWHLNRHPNWCPVGT